MQTGDVQRRISDYFLAYFEQQVYKSVWLVHLYRRIQNLEDYRFECCGEIERKALLTIIEYLYYYGKDERIMIEQILQDSQNKIGRAHV